jgi:hypothetical protein
MRRWRYRYEQHGYDVHLGTDHFVEFSNLVSGAVKSYRLN